MVYLLGVSTNHVTILRVVRYERWMHRDITEICEEKVLTFQNLWFKIIMKY
jgi:hypothetical protein